MDRELEGLTSGIGPVMMDLDPGPPPDRISVPVSELYALHQLLIELGNRHDQDATLVLEVIGKLEMRLMDMESRAVKNLQFTESLNDRLDGIASDIVSAGVHLSAKTTADYNNIIRVIRAERPMARFRAWLRRFWNR